MELTKEEAKVVSGNKWKIRISLIMGILFAVVAVGLIPYSSYMIGRVENVWAKNHQEIDKMVVVTQMEKELKSYALTATEYVMNEWPKAQEEKVLRVFMLFCISGGFLIGHALRERFYAKLIQKLLMKNQDFNL